MVTFALTDEQEKIISTVKDMEMGEILKIIAFAGTGKTSTLVAMAKALPNKKFLYLAFNKAVQLESRKRFPPNVDVYTQNGLAYRWFMQQNNGASYELRNTDYKPIEISKIFGGGTSFEESKKILKILNIFLNSGLKDFSSFEVSKKDSILVQKASDLYGMMRMKKIPITHSFYLKEFQLSGAQSSMQYDYVLLDEAQDTNDVTLNSFLLYSGAKVFVGDSHQEIYSFRGSVNAMEKIKTDYECYLTHTFRCPPSVVERANFILSRYKGEEVPIVSKHSGQTKEIETKAIISRTNSTLIDYIEEFNDFYLTREPSVIFAPSINILRWLKGDKNIDQSFQYLYNFSDLDALKKYVKTIDDKELSAAIKLIETKGGRLYGLYDKAVKNNSPESKLTLTTAHSSKGLEFDHVTLTDDYKNLELIGQSCERDVMELKEEANLFYVATTRAKHALVDLSKNSENIEAFLRDKRAREKTKKAPSIKF